MHACAFTRASSRRARARRKKRVALRIGARVAVLLAWRAACTHWRRLCARLLGRVCACVPAVASAFACSCAWLLCHVICANCAAESNAGSIVCHMVRGVRVRWVKLSQWASSRVRARENVAGAGYGGLASERVRSEPVCGVTHDCRVCQKKEAPPNPWPVETQGSLRTRSLARPPQPAPATFQRARTQDEAHWLSLTRRTRTPRTMWHKMLPALQMSAAFAQIMLHTSHAQLHAVALATVGKHARARPSTRAHRPRHCVHAARHASKAATHAPMRSATCFLRRARACREDARVNAHARTCSRCF